MLQIQGAEGEAMVAYCEPLATPEAERIITPLDNYPIQILKADRKLTHEVP
jgi:hypothetical protein